MYMRKIFVLLSVFVGLAALAVNTSDLMGTRICLLNLYDWQEDAMGNVTVSANDVFYSGGWSTDIIQGDAEGELVFAQGLAMFGVPQPFIIDESAGTVTLKAGDEPFATVTKSSTTTQGSVTTTVDTTLTYYVVNEDWLVNRGDFADVHGTILADGTIYIAEGFAYYIEQVVTTTITVGGRSQQYTDETFRVSLLMKDTWLMEPNGVHEYVDADDGESHSVPVCIRQSGDTVLVTNLYGLGWRDDYMIIGDNAEVSFPSQPIADISDSDYPDGDGVWYNAGGNTGAATNVAITWGLTTPSDGNESWSGWNNNRLSFTDGSEFVVPVTPPAGKRGDVDNDGEVSIADVTALINALLTGNWEGLNAGNADCDQNGEAAIADVTTLINYLLTGNWPD